MTDEIDNIAAKAEAATVWYKSHTSWLIGLGSFLAGVVVGYLLHR